MANLSGTRARVVLVPFPFDDLSASKVRPAVCLTDPIGPYQHIVLAFITSRVPEDFVETDLLLDSGSPGFQTTGLHMTSTVRLHRMITVTSSFIRRELGFLSSEMWMEVDRRLRVLFALS